MRRYVLSTNRPAAGLAAARNERELNQLAGPAQKRTLGALVAISSLPCNVGTAHRSAIVDFLHRA